MSNQHTRWVQRVWVIACLRQLSRRVFTIMSPELPAAMAILQISAAESNIHTVLETLASSSGSPIFSKYSTDCFKGAIKCLFCQSKSSITTVGGSTGCIKVTTPWCITNNNCQCPNLFSNLRLGVHCIPQHQGVGLTSCLPLWCNLSPLPQATTCSFRCQKHQTADIIYVLVLWPGCQIVLSNHLDSLAGQPIPCALNYHPSTLAHSLTFWNYRIQVTYCQLWLCMGIERVLWPRPCAWGQFAQLRVRKPGSYNPAQLVICS